MKFKRLISGVAAAALVVSSLSFSASANVNAKPLEVGFETAQERLDSDDYDFLKKPYTIAEGDYYMGIGVQNPNWTFRDSIGTPNDGGSTLVNVNGTKITGINNKCPWAYLYGDGYAVINKDADGNAFRSDGKVTAKGPTGIFYGESEGDSGIKEYAKLHDVMIGDNGTYTVGIQGYNWKADTAETTSDYGNGINILSITSNIKFMEKNGVTINHPTLKIYNSKEAYEAKKPDKTISTDYWHTAPGANKLNYTEYKFANIWTTNGTRDNELGREVTHPAKYLDNAEHLDVFGLTGYTGAASSKYATKFEGCQYLPEYAFEITFDVNIPDNMINKVISRPLELVLNEVNGIVNSEAELAKVQSKNPSLTVEQIKEKLTTAYSSAKGVFDQYKNTKSLSKSLLTEPQAAIDKSLDEIKAVCSELGILIWGELNGYIETAEGMDFTKYTADSWAALEDVIAEAKDLKQRYDNGEAVTQEQIDAATEKLKAAINALKEATEKVDDTSGYGYVQFKDSSGKYQWYNDGKNYKNVTAKTVDVVTSEKGNGKTYTVKAKCDGTAKGLADCNLEIQGLLKQQDSATVTVDEVKLDGKKQKLTGVPYTVAADKNNAYVPLYDSTVTEIPEDAYTSPDGKCAKDASPQALSKGAKNDYAALRAHS